MRPFGIVLWLGVDGVYLISVQEVTVRTCLDRDDWRYSANTLYRMTRSAVGLLVRSAWPRRPAR